MDHAPAVTAKGDELCVAGGGFYGHRITLLKGLPAKTGETLAANADVDFTFGDKPPYVGFQGEGVILPRDEADGLGVETVNVTRLEVPVWRVPDRNLVRKEISAPGGGGGGGGPPRAPGPPPPPTAASIGRARPPTWSGWSATSRRAR